jgi:Spy/CpxP family protein refolding chaperone
MKTSQKILSLLALAVFAGTTAAWAGDDAAPPPPPPRERPHPKEMREHRMKELDEKLHLTAEQKTQISQIFDKTEQEMRANREAAAKAGEERREKRRDAMKATHDQVRAVLTPEQQKIFDEMPRRGGPPDGHRGPPPPPKEGEKS